MSDKQKFLGEFEQFVLLSILKLGDNAYGSAIRQLLAEAVNRVRYIKIESSKTCVHNSRKYEHVNGFYWCGYQCSGYGVQYRA